MTIKQVLFILLKLLQRPDNERVLNRKQQQIQYLRSIEQRTVLKRIFSLFFGVSCGGIGSV